MYIDINLVIVSADTASMDEILLASRKLRKFLTGYIME